MQQFSLTISHFDWMLSADLCFICEKLGPIRKTVQRTSHVIFQVQLSTGFIYGSLVANEQFYE